MAQRWFDVEIIVFKRNIDPKTVTEQWSQSQPEIKITDSISLLSPSSRKKYGLSLLPKSKFKLNKEYAKLLNHAAFTPLLHLAWRQDDGNRRQMPKIRFRAGQNFQQSFHADGSSKTTENFTKTSLTNNEQTNKINEDVYELDGYIRLYVQHYLFIETDLVLKVPGERQVLDNIVATPMSYLNGSRAINLELEDAQSIANFENHYRSEPFLAPYPLKQKRRMKSGEIHYLDHPALGIIIQVRRAK